MAKSKFDRKTEIVDSIRADIDGGYGSGVDMGELLDLYASKYDDIGFLQTDILEALEEVASGLRSDIDIIQDTLIDIESLQQDIKYDFAGVIKKNS